MRNDAATVEGSDALLDDILGSLAPDMPSDRCVAAASWHLEGCTNGRPVHVVCLASILTMVKVPILISLLLRGPVHEQQFFLCFMCQPSALLCRQAAFPLVIGYTR